ncbi:hypothetical protein J3R30DRAFT_3263387, partial [Lentinula aciculospora]
LYGSAEVGKSSVVQTIAECSVQEGNLTVTSFLWREDLARNDIRRLIPTIAFQIANAIPKLRPAI